MSDQPTHPFSISASTQEGKLAAVERKIVACAMLTTGFGTLSALRVTENGKTSYQIAATCRFDVAYEEAGGNVHSHFGDMYLRGKVKVAEIMGDAACKEGPDQVCILNLPFNSFDNMWTYYQNMVDEYMAINKEWLKERAAEKIKEKGA